MLRAAGSLPTRIALGCMNVVDGAVVQAAHAAGIRVFDTARAYIDNERLLAEFLPRTPDVRVVSKGGMLRPDGHWRPDGRARTIIEHARESVAALGGIPIDTWLLHVPDDSVSFHASVRALAACIDKGLVKSVGLSNVNRAQLDAARAIVPIRSVEIPLSFFDDKAAAGGVLARCIEEGIEILAYRPFGGAKKQRALERDAALQHIARKHQATPQEVALAAVLAIDESVVVVPGPTTVAHVASCARAAALALDDDDRALLADKLDRLAPVRRPPPSLKREGEVVLLMGIQGAGKTHALSSWLAQGYERINRDERGGTMASLHKHLDERLAAGVTRVVLDNTYVSRAVRRGAIDAAWKHGLPVRGVWFNTPLASAQVNVILRILAHHGRLLGPDELRAAGYGENALPPLAQLRLLKTLELPAHDEGWSALEIVPFVRRSASPPQQQQRQRAARFVALECGAAHHAAADLVFAFGAARPASLPPHVAFASCDHGGGPPACWCRPPLPGLILDYAHRGGVDVARSTLVGAGAVHRAMAEALGCAWESVA